VAASEGKLALFLLPPYSPELNPDEYVWNDLRAHSTGRKLIISQLDFPHFWQWGTAIG